MKKLVLLFVTQLYVCTLFLVAAWGNPNESISQMELYLLGKKFSHEPISQRVIRLEEFTGQPFIPKSSSEFRKARLLAASQAQASERNKQLAIQEYNSGVDKSKQGQLEEAIRHYRQAIQHYPSLIQAYNNMANILEQQERLDEAIAMYQAAIDQGGTEDPILYRNLGVLYERVGDVHSAMNAFRSYLQRSPETDSTIQQLVEEFEQRQGFSQEVHYASMASHSSNGILLTWPAHLNPVPVYVALESPEQAIFLPLVSQSLRTWEKALHSRVYFKEVNRPDQARIIIHLKQKPLADPYENVGHAQYFVNQASSKLQATLKVSTIIHTGEPGTKTPLQYRNQQVHRLILHELGHALGIWGHSLNPNDIMYVHPLVTDLSERDITTILKLYGVSNRRAQDRKNTAGKNP